MGTNDAALGGIDIDYDESGHLADLKIKNTTALRLQRNGVTVPSGGSLNLSGTLTGNGTVSLTGTVASTSGVAPHLQTASGVLDATEIKALRASPATLVAAPAAGSKLEFVGLSLKLVAGSEVLTESTDNLAVRYADGSGAIVSEAIEATGFIDQAADTYTAGVPVADPIVAAADAEAAALVLHNTGDGEYGGNVSDDAQLNWQVWYRTVSL